LEPAFPDNEALNPVSPCAAGNALADVVSVDPPAVETYCSYAASSAQVNPSDMVMRLFGLQTSQLNSQQCLLLAEADGSLSNEQRLPVLLQDGSTAKIK